MSRKTRDMGHPSFSGIFIFQIFSDTMRHRHGPPAEGEQGQPVYSSSDHLVPDTVLSPRTINPSSGPSGGTAQGAAAGLAGAVSRRADYYTCMDKYWSTSH
jgi:hypothetical protein